jgi:TPR repeat protein
MHIASVVEAEEHLPHRRQGEGPMKTRLVSMTFAALLLLWRPVSFAGEFEDGVAALNREDYKTAVAMFTKAANNGDAKAQSILGQMYSLGRGVTKNNQQAALWYKKAADQGNARAQNNLGQAYVNGQGVPQDYKQAAS